ncbi:hypothetical protein MTO96_009881 [Rhipicephalus appendiculatus]
MRALANPCSRSLERAGTRLLARETPSRALSAHDARRNNQRPARSAEEEQRGDRRHFGARLRTSGDRHRATAVAGKTPLSGNTANSILGTSDTHSRDLGDAFAGALAVT